jgi:hypothetical protein
MNQDHAADGAGAEGAGQVGIDLVSFMAIDEHGLCD